LFQVLPLPSGQYRVSLLSTSIQLAKTYSAVVQTPTDVEIAKKPEEEKECGSKGEARSNANNSSAGKEYTVSLSTIPNKMSECESGICGVWTFTGKQGVGKWQNGAVADLTVEHYEVGSLVIRRTDPAGSQGAGLTAVYSGSIQGHCIEGTVDWTLN